ncbi:MAG TPA: hypothetical protein PL002_05020, partial [Flavobacteriales bacterium]|nr:hypothetical protein [Flavobacteriales bacterium]
GVGAVFLGCHLVNFGLVKVILPKFSLTASIPPRRGVWRPSDAWIVGWRMYGEVILGTATAQAATE